MAERERKKPIVPFDETLEHGGGARLVPKYLETRADGSLVQGAQLVGTEEEVTAAIQDLDNAGVDYSRAVDPLGGNSGSTSSFSGAGRKRMKDTYEPEGPRLPNYRPGEEKPGLN